MAAFSTGFHVGDALYRDLLLAVTQHWHGGLYVGFSVDAAGTGRMLGIHAANGIGWSDAMTFFQATRSFAAPDADIAVEMASLRTDLLTAFADNTPNHPFHGARHAPGMSLSKRIAITQTAGQLIGKNIWWTWVDQLDYKWFDWDGSPSDIDESRCDGVIEYAYEKNGVRVCGGTNAARWNISNAGTEFPENHNDFHNNAYNPGELCPRIQAGDQANDTTFIEEAATPPEFLEFKAYPFAFIFVPSIWFKVKTQIYPRALIRLTVRRQQGQWHFVVAEDPYGGTLPAGFLGAWRFRTAPANTAQAQYVWWLGKTSGPDFRGQDGDYEFRAVAVDEAGNVSDTSSATVHIDWPRPPAIGPREISCVVKRRRADPYSAIRFVGGLSGGTRWRMTLGDAILAVERGEPFYVEQPTGDRVAVVVAVSALGNKYLKTVADGDLPNNLLSLPECP